MTHVISNPQGKPYTSEQLGVGFYKPDTPFLTFWATVNRILNSRGEPTMLYGEARDWWVDYQRWAA